VAAIEEAVRLYRDLGLRTELATSLNNASNRYSDLAGQEETREGRVQLLEQAVATVEEAARLYRDLGLRAELAASLNNASLRYSDLAGQEETRDGRVQLLQQAVAAIEEAARLYHDLGLRADLAASLNNASLRYSDLAGQEETREGRVQLLQQAVAAIEEAVTIRRDLGLRADLATSLNNASNLYSDLRGRKRRGRGGGSCYSRRWPPSRRPPACTATWGCAPTWRCPSTTLPRLTLA